MESGMLHDWDRYTNPPRYRCPRCAARTCSLPCYKRHQQRASCSGKRDPSTFLSKSKLATPAGLDHDYNYLAGIERRIDNTGRDLRERGVLGSGDGSDRAGGKGKAWKPDSALHRYLHANRIDVVRAPVGMSRQRANETRATKSGKVVWTVEWRGGGAVGDGGHLQQHCSESASISELYATFQKERQKRERQEVSPKQTPELRRKRAKLDDSGQVSVVKSPEPTRTSEKGALDPHSSMLADGVDTDKPDESVSTVRAVVSGDDPSQPVPGSHADSRVISTPQVDNTNSDQFDSGPSTYEPQPSNIFKKDAKAMASILEISEEQAKPDRMPKDHYFYLHLPETPGHTRIIHPLTTTSSLTTSLRDRKVLEFPTIYILETSPDQPLPPGFTLADAYRASLRAKSEAKAKKRHDADGVREAKLNADDRNQTSGTGSQRERESGEVDVKGILDMLRRK